jgi:hypothetical protein
MTLTPLRIMALALLAGTLMVLSSCSTRASPWEGLRDFEAKKLGELENQELSSLSGREQQHLFFLKEKLQLGQLEERMNEVIRSNSLIHPQIADELATAQAAWLAYRDADTNYEAKFCEGG